MKNRSLCKFISLIAVLALLAAMICLTGCDESMMANIYADLRTDMVVDDGFSGQRIMTASFNRQLAVDTFEDIEKLTDIVTKATPSQLKCELSDDGVTAAYVFTLSFSSLDEYKAKVAELIGREPEVKFDKVDQTFMKGLSYQEDFESSELFKWVEEGIKTLTFISETDKFNSATFWRQQGVSVKIGSNTYDCANGNISIPESQTMLLSKIGFKTTLKKDAEFERTIEFKLPGDIGADNYAGVIDFCEKNKPESATVAQASSDEQKIVSVTFKAVDQNALAQKTTQVLQCVCQASFTNVQDNDLPFSTLRQFDEQLDFTGICMDTAIPFTYNLTSESGTPSQLDFRLDGVDVSGEPTLGGNTLDYGSQGSRLTMSMRFESISTANSIYYNLLMNGSDSFDREIIIMMDNGTDSYSLDRIKSYYDSKQAKNTIITTLPNGYSVDVQNPCVTIRITGSGKDIARAEDMLFSGNSERKLGYDRQKSIFKVKPSTTLVDNYDISSLLSMTNVTDYIYTFTANDDLVSSSIVTAGKMNEDTDEVEAGEVIGYLMEDGIASITFNGKYTNTEAIIFIILLIILALLILALAAVLLYKYWQKKNEEENKPEPQTEPEKPSIPEPVYEEPVALPAPEPVRDFTYVIEEEEEPKQEIEIESFPSSTQENDFADVYNSMDLSAQDEVEEEEPEEEEKAIKVEVRPFVPVYAQTEEKEPEPETEAEPVVIPEPEEKAPEVPFAASPFEDEYTDEKFMEDLDSLGLLDEYVDRVSKVKVKVKKRKSE